MHVTGGRGWGGAVCPLRRDHRAWGRVGSRPPGRRHGVPWPAHASCNRAAGAALAHERWYEDDPARGIFWGPPSEPGGMPMRWSRPWFDWR